MTHLEQLEKSIENIEVWQKAISEELNRVRKNPLLFQVEGTQFPEENLVPGYTTEMRAKILGRRRKNIKYS